MFVKIGTVDEISPFQRAASRTFQFQHLWPQVALNYTGNRPLIVQIACYSLTIMHHDHLSFALVARISYHEFHATLAL